MLELTPDQKAMFEDPVTNIVSEMTTKTTTVYQPKSSKGKKVVSEVVTSAAPAQSVDDAPVAVPTKRRGRPPKKPSAPAPAPAPVPVQEEDPDEVEVPVAPPKRSRGRPKKAAAPAAVSSGRPKRAAAVRAGQRLASGEQEGEGILMFGEKPKSVRRRPPTYDAIKVKNGEGVIASSYTAYPFYNVKTPKKTS